MYPLGWDWRPFFLAQADPDGPTHDQRGGDGLFASGESLLWLS
ncbi:Protein ABHD18 [Takifugu flavidus]|uniref:Protein ABHD18 n=1 Tax=Takifugu flavidus TaxID=433684 RepID=A0A5C6MM61_9TELE|nr:Protein ABHD18 [Takifugu flavidus]